MKIIVTIVAIVATALLGLGVISPANAQEWTKDRGDHAKCVNRAEWHELYWSDSASQHRMKKADVERLLDGPGYQSSDWRGDVRDYRPCGMAWENGRVTVHYGPRGFYTFASRLTIDEHGKFALPLGHPRA